MKNIGTERIETPRLILRRITETDIPAAFEYWCQDKDVTKYVMWSVHKDIDVTKKLFLSWIKEYEDDTTYNWIVCLKDTGEQLGTINIVNKKLLEFGTAEIGYCFKKNSWGKGYGTESLKAVIKYLFEKCQMETIYAEYMSNNIASGKVMEKSGMTYEGTLKSRLLDKDGIRNDLISYSITKEEYFKNI